MAMAPESSARYDTGHAFIAALKAPVVVHHKSDQCAVVVLPFVNQSPGADHEFFSDGLTEEISTDLARIKSLRVISRMSALRFKGTTKDIATIGRELGVQCALESTVRKAGASLRIQRGEWIRARAIFCVAMRSIGCAYPEGTSYTVWHAAETAPLASHAG